MTRELKIIITFFLLFFFNNQLSAFAKSLNNEIDVNNRIREISQKGIGVTLIENESGTVLGLITDGDVRRAIESSEDFLALNAIDFMTKKFSSVSSDQLASDCLETMAEKKIGCLIVMEADEVKGIVNQKDLVKLGL